VIGINPATDSPQAVITLLELIDEVREYYAIPAQSSLLAHVTTQIAAIERGAPVDLVFQSIAGTEAANASFGITLSMLQEAREAALALKRGTLGDNVMYFETGQGSALSANAHHGLDQQTCEARAYAVARHFQPLLVNTVVGFIGPEYLYDGKQIMRAALEDHFCGKSSSALEPHDEGVVAPEQEPARQVVGEAIHPPAPHGVVVDEHDAQLGRCGEQ
jgi:ethanolamine ammonia-lyase large subunit